SVSSKIFQIIFKTSFTLFLTVVATHKAFAIDCKRAHEKWEMMVCKDEDLKILDNALNDIYKKCFKTLKDANKIKKEQQEWIKHNTSITNLESDLEDTYLSRISTLREYYFKEKKRSSVSKVINNQNIPYIPYRFYKESIDGETLLEYPLLFEK